MGKLKIHKCQLYPVSMIYCRKSQADLLRKIAHIDKEHTHTIENVGEGSYATTFKTYFLKNSMSVICVVFEDEKFPISKMAHEAIHVADFVFSWIGGQESVDPSTANEPYAYLVDWIVRCMCESLGIE